MAEYGGAARVAVLVPCFNEAATIAKVVGDFRRLLPEATVYVYDNNSTDETAQLARSAGAVVASEYRQGKGNVVRRMFRDIDADCYVMVDGDDTYPAEDTFGMVALVVDGRADMVIGDRLSSTYFAENSRRFHGAGNLLVRGLINRLFSSDVHDIMTGCRCFSRQFVKAFPVTSSGFEIETEMTIHALDKRFLIREVPVAYRDRVDGSESKLQTIPDGLRVLRTLLLLYRDHRPMGFFGMFSVVFMLAAVVLFVGPLNDYLTTGLVPRIPSLVVSIACGIASLLALACGVILESIRSHARQSYEQGLTLLAEIDRVGRRRS